MIPRPPHWLLLKPLTARDDEEFRRLYQCQWSPEVAPPATEPEPAFPQVPHPLLQPFRL